MNTTNYTNKQEVDGAIKLLLADSEHNTINTAFRVIQLSSSYKVEMGKRHKNGDDYDKGYHFTLLFTERVIKLKSYVNDALEYLNKQ